MKNFIGNNIHALRIHKGLSQEQFAKMAGASQSAVSAWECGTSTPRQTNIQHILDAVPELTSDDLLSADSGYAQKVLTGNNHPNTHAKAPLTSRGLAAVPLFGSIAAGNPIDMLTSDERYTIPREIYEKHPQAFLLKVEGESMNRVIPNGSYALIDPALCDIHDKRVYAVSIDNNAATIKRIRKLNNGVELRPDSNDPTYKPLVFDYAEDNPHTLSILGQVVWYTIPYGFEL